MFLDLTETLSLTGFFSDAVRLFIFELTLGQNDNFLEFLLCHHMYMKESDALCFCCMQRKARERERESVCVCGVCAHTLPLPYHDTCTI